MRDDAAEAEAEVLRQCHLENLEAEVLRRLYLRALLAIVLGPVRVPVYTVVTIRQPQGEVGSLIAALVYCGPMKGWVDAILDGRPTAEARAEFKRLTGVRQPGPRDPAPPVRRK